MSLDNHYFNPQPPTWMHIDLNSCFATIEQQANPLLRGKPIAITAYGTDKGCILAPSIEAKRYGVKTGMRFGEGRTLCPSLIALPSDPAKYRFVNKKLHALFNEYSPRVSVRSIDEMVLDFSGSLPVIARSRSDEGISLTDIGQEIKQRIKKEIGDWLTVSIGIANNPYLAKLAAGIHKPDGLDVIQAANILATLQKMDLMDLPYIKERNTLRLRRVGIWTPIDFYTASPAILRRTFGGVVGEYWYLRLHGFPVDEVDWSQKSIGHSYHLIKFTEDKKELKKLLCKLVEKMGRRIRRNAYTARGIHLSLLFSDDTYWHEGRLFPHPMYAFPDLFRSTCFLLEKAPPKKVRILAVSSYALEKQLYGQLSILEDEDKKKALSQALDKINNTYGEFTITPATMMHMDSIILDRIAFGKAGV